MLDGWNYVNIIWVWDFSVCNVRAEMHVHIYRGLLGLCFWGCQGVQKLFENMDFQLAISQIVSDTFYILTSQANVFPVGIIPF